jgi:hypothetical protein
MDRLTCALTKETSTVAHDHAIRIWTDARYRGMPVTVAGDVVERLFAFAAYDSADPQVLGVITIDPATPDEPYRLEGDSRPLKTVRDAARVAVERSKG